MRFRDFYLEYTVLAKHFQSLALLLARLVVAYGFYNPALLKWSNFDTTVAWFIELGIPFASLATFLTASIEISAVVLLILGLFTRFITIPLMVIMVVAIVTVHYVNGFSAGNDGFEIPLYYFLFLSLFATHGAGKFSLDYILFKRGKQDA